MVEESEIRAFKKLITKGNFLYSRNKTRDSMNYFDINQVVWFLFLLQVVQSIILLLEELHI